MQFSPFPSYSTPAATAIRTGETTIRSRFRIGGALTRRFRRKGRSRFDDSFDMPESTADETLARPEAPRRAPRGKPYTREVDWRTVTLVGAAAAAGLAVGAGIALLAAPHSGAHTRLALARELRRRRPWRRSPWDRLGDELAETVQRRNRRARLRAAAEARQRRTGD